MPVCSVRVMCLPDDARVAFSGCTVVVGRFCFCPWHLCLLVPLFNFCPVVHWDFILVGCTGFSMFLDLFQPVGLLMLKPSSFNIILRPFTIIGLGTPGREGGQHPIVQAIHGRFMARGRGSYPLLVCVAL